MLFGYLSEARLKRYVEMCANEDDAIELHSEAMLVGSALLAAISMVEIALRNRIHQRIADDFANDHWLTAEQIPLILGESERQCISKAISLAKQDRYAKLTNSEKRSLDRTAFPQGVPKNIRHGKLSKKRQKMITVSEGEVVAHTTLFFWKRFFAPEYEPLIWKRSVRKLFPNKKLSRSTVSEHIETLYVARNRLAHHEPMYGQRLQKSLEALSFVRENLDSRFPDANAPLCRLTQVQYQNLVSKKAEFDEAWRRLAIKRE